MLGTAVLGVAVEGVAVDGVAVDGTAVDGVTVDGVAVEGVAVVGVGVGASVAPGGEVGAGVVGLTEGDGAGPGVGLNANSPTLTRQYVSIASARRLQSITAHEPQTHIRCSRARIAIPWCGHAGRGRARDRRAGRGRAAPANR